DQRRFAGRLLPLTPFVVQTDAHDVVGWAASLRGDRPHYAAARGPSSPQIAEGADSGNAGHSDRRTILDEAIGSAACAVKKDVRGPGQRCPALFPGGPNPGFVPPHPGSELLVAPRLDAADVMWVRHGPDAGQRGAEAPG